MSEDTYVCGHCGEPIAECKSFADILVGVAKFLDQQENDDTPENA